MGQSSELAIEQHNEQMANDEYAENYNRAMDEALYQAWLEQEMENETQIEWFDDFRLAHNGFEEQDEPENADDAPAMGIDDLPF